VVDAIVLDLDDTLLDHRGSATRALASWLPGLGLPASAELADAWFALEEKYWAAWRIGSLDLSEARRRRVAGLLATVGRAAVADDTLDALFGDYLTAYEASWFAFPDALDTLAALHAAGHRLAVLTNGAAVQQRAKLAAIGAAPFLDAVFTAEDLRLAKPDPAVFAETCRRLGREPARVLHVGDRHDLDVLPARAAGLVAVHLDRHGSGPHDELHRITSLRELPALVADRFA
jgi:putative hydrolase of the HAD superfamily